MEPAPLPRLSRPRDASSGGFLEAAGRRAAFLGEERGVFECWIWPIKLFHGLRLAVRIDGSSERIEASELPGQVEVRPDRVRLEFRHPLFRVQETLQASLDRRALAILLEADCDAPLELELSLQPDFRPMWPAGLGGQITSRDPQTGAIVLTEELGRFAAFVGCAEALPDAASADHGLPRDPLRLRIPVGLARMEQGPVAVVVAGAQTSPPPLSKAARLGEEGAALGHARSARVVELAREEYLAAQRGWSELALAHERHWRGFLARTARVETPDAQLDEAFLWAKIAIEKAWVEVDGLGRGLVAGLATSGSGERPGFGWFFDGDALVAARAMLAYGDFEGALAVLELAASHQRSDGKMMHELTLSAGLCNWIEDYPYAYYKGVNTPDFVAAVCEYAAATGDERGARRLLPHVERAFAHCLGGLDEHGLLSVEKLGLASMEAGPLCGRIASDVFLHGLWLSALKELSGPSGARLSRALHERAREELPRALAAFGRFWSARLGRHGFARLVDGSSCEDLSAYLAQPLSLAAAWPHGSESRTQARSSLAFLNRPELASDWGLRMFSVEAAIYDPAHYNTGSVFPYLNRFAIEALALLDPAAAWQLLRSQVRLHGFSGLGLVPEHLRGDRAVAPERGVPHQIFSSATIVLATLQVLLGLKSAAGELALAPTLPPDWDRAAVRGFRAGASRVAVALARERERGRATLGVRLEVESGPPVDAAIQASGRGTLDEDQGPAREIRRVQVTKRAELSLAEPSRPELLLEVAPLEAGRESEDLRLADASREGTSITWIVWGRAGRLYRARVFCDRELDIEGAERAGSEPPWSAGGAPLEIRISPGETGAFVQHRIRAAPRPEAR